MKATRECSIEGCTRRHQARGWCQAHYRRWRETGDPGPLEIERRAPGRICAVDECGDPVRCGDWCKKHYARWLKHGDPNFRWRLDEVGYGAAHQRLRKVRGPARAHPCVGCGAPAKEWAYDNADPNELRGDNHGLLCAYSLDVNHYMPMCRPCHHNFDNAHAGRNRFPVPLYSQGRTDDRTIKLDVRSR